MLLPLHYGPILGVSTPKQKYDSSSMVSCFRVSARRNQRVLRAKRSATQRRRARRFDEFGCSACHKLTPGKMGLIETGAKLAGLYLGCVEVEKLVAGSPAPQR